MIFPSTVFPLFLSSHVRLVPPAALPQQPRPVALRMGDAVLHANGAPPPLLSIQAQLIPKCLSNPRPRQVPHCLFLNPHHHVPQVCMSTYCMYVLKNTPHINCLLSSQGPSHQSSGNPSMVSLYPTLGYRTIMHDMSPAAFGRTSVCFCSLFSKSNMYVFVDLV